MITTTKLLTGKTRGRILQLQTHHSLPDSYIHTYIYIYMHTYVCVCVCVCVRIQIVLYTLSLTSVTV